MWSLLTLTELKQNKNSISFMTEAFTSHFSSESDTVVLYLMTKQSVFCWLKWDKMGNEHPQESLVKRKYA